MTLFTHITSHPFDSDLIIESQSKEVQTFLCKPHKDNNYINSAYLGNAGMSIINRNLLEQKSPPQKPISLFQYLAQIEKNKKLRIFSYNTTEFIKDIGTPERFRKTEELLFKDKIKDFSYKNKQRALFLDRDGTLIKCQKGRYILSQNEIKYKNDIITFIKSIIHNYTLCIIVTNQPQISMGLVDYEKVSEINGKIINDLYSLGIKIDLYVIWPSSPSRRI